MSSHETASNMVIPNGATSDETVPNQPASNEDVAMGEAYSVAACNRTGW